MGAKSFVQELKLKVSRSRLFKAFVTESIDVLPKVSTNIKSIQIVEGHAFAPGCVYNIHFTEGGHISHMKNRVDVIDQEKFVCKFTTLGGDALGEKVEKIVHELKVEESGDGGCVAKLKSEYHPKAGVEISDDEIKAGEKQSRDIYKACEDYLLKNPNVCA